MNGLTEDWTAELISRDQIKFSGANGCRENNHFSVQLATSMIGNLTRLIDTVIDHQIQPEYGERTG